MKIVFVSNFMNHHQLPLSQMLMKESEYYFVATEQIPEERVSMGYKDMNKEYPFIIRYYASSEEMNRAKSVINDADIVIYGSAPFELVEERIKSNRLTFRYSERLFKSNALVSMFNPRVIYSMYKTATKYRSKNYYLLCASAYSAKDYAWYGAFKGKSFKWGYFPRIDKINDVDKVIKTKLENKQILWAGRFIGWKHPEYALLCAQYLKDNKIDFKIKMVGNGILLEEIKQEIRLKQLENYIEVVGPLPFDMVQSEMRKSLIFLFTSDKGEGWGAVLNESMGNGCIVLANKEIGSVPYLIEDGKNGFSYKNKKEFLFKFQNILSQYDNMHHIIKKACETVNERWNAETAARNLLEVSKSLLNDRVVDIKLNEPCSRA